MRYQLQTLFKRKLKFHNDNNFDKEVVRLTKRPATKGLQPLGGCQRLTEVDRIIKSVIRILIMTLQQLNSNDGKT